MLFREYYKRNPDAEAIVKCFVKAKLIITKFETNNFRFKYL